jgi:uncharacterized iron-regulated membrane protein
MFDYELRAGGTRAGTIAELLKNELQCVASIVFSYFRPTGNSIRNGREAMRGLCLVLAAAMAGGMVSGTLFGQAAATASATKSAKSAKTPVVMPTDAEIADAKARGLVWANENTKVYHKDDAQYGKTKHGKFMAEVDAQAAGYRLAKASPIGKKKGAAAAPTAPQ